MHAVRPPVKHAANPLYRGDSGYVNVARNSDTGKFQLWTQIHRFVETAGERKSRYAIANAESDDGLNWNAPNLGLFEWNGSTQNNVVIRGPKNARASGPQLLLTLPEDQKRGYRYIMTYRTGGAGKESDGIRLIGSQDGIHWDANSDTQLKHIHSDTLNSIVYDPRRKRFFMTCRAKDRYRRFKGSLLDTGASRRVSYLTNDNLWTKWEGSPTALLTPDEIDAKQHYNFFYGMPVHYHAGIYWGVLVGLSHERSDPHRIGHQPRRDPLETSPQSNAVDSAWPRKFLG